MQTNDDIHLKINNALKIVEYNHTLKKKINQIPALDKPSRDEMPLNKADKPNRANKTKNDMVKPQKFIIVKMSCKLKSEF